MEPAVLFTRYLIAGVETVLTRVQAAPYVVPEADRQQAWHLLSFALKVEAAWPATRALLLALAPKMELAGFREEWIPYLDKGRERAEQLGDLQVVAECELQIGMLYRLMSRFEEAHRLTETSIKHFTECGDHYAQARALNELAWLEHLQHHYEKAADDAQQALAQLSQHDPECAMSYRVLGMIALYQTNYQEAENYHRKAVTLLAKSGEKQRIAWCLQNLALALRWQNHNQEAIQLFRKAAKILYTTGDISNWGITQMNLGSAHYHSGKPLKALRYLDRAAAIANKLQDKLQIARIYTHLGLAHLALHDFDHAEETFLTSSAMYDLLGDISWHLNAIDGLAMAYIASEQFEKAIEILQAAILKLPKIESLPNYGYLYKSLNNHLAIAQQASKTRLR